MQPTTLNSPAISICRALIVALLFWSGTGTGQELLYHLPLDGSLDNHGRVGGEPAMYVKDGEAAPEFVPGRIGQAMHFDSKAAIAVPFELDHDDYPQVTITAWVRQDLATSGTRAVLSSGSDAGARLQVGGRLAVKAGRTGVSFDEDMPRGEWVFVAGVIDVANGWARLHQNDAVYLREGIDTSAKAPKEFRAPNDPDGSKQAYLFVGAHQFRNWQQTTRAVTIDDVRLYAGALSEKQVMAIRDKRMAESSSRRLTTAEQRCPRATPQQSNDPDMVLPESEPCHGVVTAARQAPQARTGPGQAAATIPMATRFNTQ